jgi:hypothetical protein
MAVEATTNHDDELNREYDQIMRENRRGREMWESAREYPDIHFNYFTGDPWTEVVGAFKDDPYFDVWQEEIQAYRERCDQEAEKTIFLDAAA